jgi:DNA-binding beta-propeller fold protein YncE
VAVDPTGKYLYTADFDILPTNASTVSGFAIDPATGFLTPVPGSPFLAGRNPFSVAITGRRLACHE